MGAAPKIPGKGGHAPAHDYHDDDHGGGHEGGGHGEPWLVSYADMMTLLYGFFVIMYSLTLAKLEDEDVMVRVRKEVAAYFGGQYLTPTKDIVDDFKKKMDPNDQLKNFNTKLYPEGFEISMQSQSLFASGEATLKPDAQLAINRLIGTLKQKHGTDFKVTVEGHTDDVPIKTKFFPTNWELSGARASSVIRMFEAAGFPLQNLMAVGYGPSRPAFPNRRPNGRMWANNQLLNRRVVIKVFQVEPTMFPTAAPSAAPPNAKTSDEPVKDSEKPSEEK